MEELLKPLGIPVQWMFRNLAWNVFFTATFSTALVMYMHLRVHRYVDMNAVFIDLAYYLTAGIMGYWLSVMLPRMVIGATKAPKHIAWKLVKISISITIFLGGLVMLLFFSRY